jgi:hypothetical protein
MVFPFARYDTSILIIYTNYPIIDTAVKSNHKEERHQWRLLRSLEEIIGITWLRGRRVSWPRCDGRPEPR